jgi:hypothetical protein
MKKLTKTERADFMYCYGQFYAGLGGTFGTYREAGEAFVEAKKFKPYAQLEISFVTDFPNFETGFNTFQKLRIALQKQKAQSEARMKALLVKIDFDAPNYMYDGKNEAPEKKHCVKCARLNPCNCKGKYETIQNTV